MSERQPHRQALRDLLAADHPPRPGQGPGQLPWHEPEFSERMLSVHLDPATQMASRAPAVIGRHLDWLEAQLRQYDLPDRCRILDVGCGPGLYCHELARRGHQTVGFDFAPAALAWAKQQAGVENLASVFFTADLRDLPPDLAQRTGPVDAVTFWYGEFHSFAPGVAKAFIEQLAACLKPGGLFVLEYQPWDLFVRRDSNEWSMCERSVFCDEPHLWLQEFAWDEASRTEVHVHWIITQESGTLQRYEQCHLAWPEAELVELLAGARLGDPTFHPPITGVAEEFEFPLLVTRRVP